MSPALWLFLLAALAGYVVWNHRPPRDLPVLRFSRPLHMSHRGGAALGPENTLPTFRQAVEVYGTEVLELDLRASAEGIPVVCHDADVSRTTNGRGAVCELTFQQLQELDAAWWFSRDGGRTYPLRGQGYRIPSLEEVLEAFPHTRLHLDVKQAEPGICQILLDLLRRRQAQDRVFLGSSQDQVARRLRRGGPEFATFPARYGLWQLYWMHQLRLFWLYHFRDEVVSLPAKLRNGREVVTSRLVRSLQARGRRLFVWVVDDQDHQRRLLELGVDGIMTDRPDLLRACLDAWESSDARKAAGSLG